MNKDINILLTSVGRRSYLTEYFKEALDGRGKVHVSNSSDISPAFQVADNSVVTPLIYDSSYIPFLLDYCRKNKIDAVISLFDVDLPILSAAKEQFAEIGTQVIVSSPNTLAITNDKWATYLFLKKNGFDAPRTFISLDDAEKALENGEISFPVIIKPRWGMGSIAISEAESFEELYVFYKKTLRKIKQTYLKYESAADEENSVLIQEKIEGQEYGLDVINDLDGNYCTTIVKMKYAMRAGETDCAITVDKPEFKKLGKAVSEKLRHIGNLDIDAFESNGRFMVLEMNARFGGGYPFSHMAGVNLPKQIVEWLRGGKTDMALLSERINVMPQKDINLVRLYMNYEVNLIHTDDYDKIREAIYKLEGNIIPSMTMRSIDIESYAEKISRHADVWILEGPRKVPVGILAGYINNMETRMAYITMMALDPHYRGLKLGEKLLSAYEEKAAEKGMKTGKLEISKKNSTGIEFYRHYGYHIVEDASESTFYMMKFFN